jgi:hypothetical protein
MTSKIHFTSYADSLYADRFIALYLSIKKFHPDLSWTVMDLDGHLFDILKRVGLAEEINTVSVHEICDCFPDLYQIKEVRPKWDFYLTCRSHFVLYKLQQLPSGEGLICLDADFFCMGKLDELFTEISRSDVAITPHRFPQEIAVAHKYGNFNAGFTYFRNVPNGIACALDWCEKCRQSCSATAGDNSYTDQKYLDFWPQAFNGVVAIDHPGINAAPWNIGARHLHIQAGIPWLDDYPILLYHFHGFHQLTPGGFYHGLTTYRAYFNEMIRNYLYQPYLDAIKHARGLLGWDTECVLLPLQKAGDMSQRKAYTSSLWASSELADLANALLIEAKASSKRVPTYRSIISKFFSKLSQLI